MRIEEIEPSTRLNMIKDVKLMAEHESNVIISDDQAYCVLGKLLKNKKNPSQLYAVHTTTLNKAVNSCRRD